MKLSEMPFNEIRIGQIIRIDATGKYGWICGLDAESVAKNKLSKGPRYDSVEIEYESGNISTPIFHMSCNNLEVVDKILNDKERFNWQKYLKDLPR